MRKGLLFIAIVSVGFACRSRPIKPGGAELKTIKASMDVLDRPTDLKWSWKNIELICRTTAGDQTYNPTSQSDENGQDHFYFEPPQLIAAAKCRLKIKIFETQSSFSRYEWQSVPEEPGLLYISDFQELEGGKLDLKMYKVYKLKAPKKEPIVLLEDDCYGAVVSGNCFDRRDADISEAKGPWWGVIFGVSMQEKNGRQQFIVSEKQGPTTETTRAEISIEALIEDLNRPVASQKFGWFKIGAKDKFTSSKYENNFLSSAGLASSAVLSLNGFKPLHIDQVFSWGFQVVDKKVLDDVGAANWFVSIEAEKGSETRTAIVGGALVGWGGVRSGSSYWSESKPFPSIVTTHWSTVYKAYTSDSAAVPMMSKCGEAIDEFLDHAPWSSYMKPATSYLTGCEAKNPTTKNLDPSILQPLYDDTAWELSHEYWLEGWHGIL